MSEILDVRDEVMALSLLPESAINTPYVLTEDFVKILTEPMPLQEPKWTKSVDNKNVGDGSRHARKTTRQYLMERAYPFNHDLNTAFSNTGIVRTLGGTPSNTAVTSNTGCFSHIVPQGLGSGVKFSSLLHKLGSLGFLNWSMFFNSYTIKQTGADTPTISFDAKNAGGFHTVHSYDDDVLKIPSTLVPGSIAAPPEYFNYLGAKTTIIFSDGVTSYDFNAGNQRLLDLEITVSQNVVIKPMPGDLQLHATKTKFGYVPNRVYHATPTVKVSFTILLTDSDVDFKLAMDKTQLQNLKVKFEGEKMNSGGTAFYSNEHKFPKCEFGDLGSGMDDTFGTLSRTLESPNDIFGDPATGGLVVVTIQDKVATLV